MLGLSLDFHLLPCYNSYCLSNVTDSAVLLFMHPNSLSRCCLDTTTARMRGAPFRSDMKVKRTCICPDCGAPIVPRAVRCRSCASKKRMQNPDLRERIAKGRAKPEHKAKRQAERKSFWQSAKGIALKEKLSQIGHTFFGENNPRWKGGINRKADLRTSTLTDQWRKSVFERDNYTCQKCGAYGGKLHPHHIKSWSKFPELRLDVSNGITLCVPCHQKEHRWHVRPVKIDRTHVPCPLCGKPMMYHAKSCKRCWLSKIKRTPS